MITVEDAFRLVAQHVEPLSTTSVPLGDALGMTLAVDATADRDSPPWRKSIMDGFAVCADDIGGSSTTLEIIETVAAGASPTKRVQSGQATRIMTGAPMPEGADSVVMIERCKIDEAASQVNIEEMTLRHGQHVMDRKSNFAEGQLIFAAGHRVRDIDIGLLAEVGAATVEVHQRPTAAVLPTGDELVDVSLLPEGPQIRNSNGPMLLAMLNSRGVEAVDLGIGRDDRDDLLAKMKQGLESDLLLLSGGVSAGTRDLVPQLLIECGVQEVFHKVKMKPGKPVFFGTHVRADGRRGFVFGLPGNPVSSLVGFRLLVCHALARMAGSALQSKPTLPMYRTANEHQTRGDRPTFWPGRIVESDAGPLVEALDWKGSSDLRTLGHAEGLIEFSIPGKTYPKSELLPFWPL